MAAQMQQQQQEQEQEQAELEQEQIGPYPVEKLMVSGVSSNCESCIA